jgi:hypothetical protein
VLRDFNATPVVFLYGADQADILKRIDVAAIEVKDEKHLGCPLADAANVAEEVDQFLVGFGVKSPRA